MQCAFCGTENRPEFKFCGMCGVRLERRHEERRASPAGQSAKCPSCGHMNEAGLKFCGMCGTRTERRQQERRGAEGDAGRAAAIANAQLPTPDAATRNKIAPPRVVTATESLPDVPPAGLRRDSAIFRNELPPDGRSTDSSSRGQSSSSASVSGPSFLGLNSQSSGDGEYLLEDEPSGGGLRKLVLLVIIAAIIGLVFVQWRSSFKANPKPAPAKSEPATLPPPQGSNQPPPATGDQPAKDASAGAGDSDPAKAGDPAKVKDVKDEAEKPIASTTPDASASSADNARDADEKAPEADKAETTSNSKPPEAASLPDHKPSPALVRAQQYLQGRGVPQNCEQGLLYLHAATDKNDPGAAIQMAALYSSGHCVKQDRVMAYRWFNSAHELEPANMWIQKNMDQLWAQMSSQERRLAGY